MAFPTFATDPLINAALSRLGERRASMLRFGEQEGEPVNVQAPTQFGGSPPRPERIEMRSKKREFLKNLLSNFLANLGEGLSAAAGAPPQKEGIAGFAGAFAAPQAREEREFQRRILLNRAAAEAGLARQRESQAELATKRGELIPSQIENLQSLVESREKRQADALEQLKQRLESAEGISKANREAAKDRLDATIAGRAKNLVTLWADSVKREQGREPTGQEIAEFMKQQRAAESRPYITVRDLYDNENNLLGIFRVNHRTGAIDKIDVTGTGQPASTKEATGIPAGIQERLAGYDTAKDLFSKVEPLIRAGKKSFGPAVGRVKLFEVNKLGGLGATQEQIELAQRLRQIVAERAFANGGKQLTVPEKAEFIALSPAMSDTLDKALIQIRLGVEYLNVKRQKTINLLTPRQRGMIGGKPKTKASDDPLGIR